MGLAGLGLSPSFLLSSSLGPTSRRRRFESGDHEYSGTLPSTVVSCVASPPVRGSSHTCVPLSLSARAERKASHFPSGLQRGADSASLLDVTRTCVDPSQLVIHTSVSDLSATASVVLSV